MTIATPKNVLSIQSHVAYGRVGNGAAAFPLERLGFEVWRVNTVQYSNHPGYGGWTGQVLPAGQVAALIEGIAARGVLKHCDAVLSGYIGDASLGEVILRAVALVRQANPGAVYACDPVMGDEGPGLYVRPDIPDFMRQSALPAADILTPNLFELRLLTGQPAESREEILAAAQELLTRGPRCIVVTSVSGEGRERGKAGDGDNGPEIEMLAVAPEGAWRVATPYLAMDPAPNGAGDAVSALFLGYRLRGLAPSEALGRAAASIFAVMEATAKAGARELQLVAAQDDLLAPQRTFDVTQIA